MIKVIFFDFFGVIVSEGFKQFRDAHFPDDEAKWEQAIALVNQHDSGRMTKEGFIAGMAELSGETPEYVADNINQNRPNRQLLDYIRTELKPGYKIGVLSNSGDDYLSRMLTPADAALFDDVVLSYRYKVIKPQTEIFELAARRMAVQPEECLHIDDSPSHCQGARQAGMRAILYKDFPNFRQEIEAVLSAGPDD